MKTLESSTFSNFTKASGVDKGLPNTNLKLLAQGCKSGFQRFELGAMFGVKDTFDIRCSHLHPTCELRLFDSCGQQLVMQHGLGGNCGR